MVLKAEKSKGISIIVCQMYHNMAESKRASKISGEKEEVAKKTHLHDNMVTTLVSPALTEPQQKGSDLSKCPNHLLKSPSFTIMAIKFQHES